MKSIIRSLFTVSFLLTLYAGCNAQLAFSPFVDSIANLATNSDILLLERQLTGDTTVTINNELVTINSRHYLSSGNEKASQFIFDKFEEYGYTPEFQYFNSNRGTNVIATKTGSIYPDKIYIICGHYDNMPSGENAPGADDNASGTVATMMAAKLLSNLDLAYTVKFIAWDEEEIGLVGSAYYAQQAALNNENILGVLNLDMIAWDSNNDMTYSIATNEISTDFTNDFILTTDYYQPALNHNFISITASDHSSFWDQGYPAILAIEDWYDFNQYYHTVADDIPTLNMDLFRALTRASIANIASNALNQRYSFNHTPITSSVSEEPREATIVITGDNKIDTSEFLPRLYFSTTGLMFNFVLPVEISGDTYRFQIPGFPIGTTVYYYFAVQDENSTMVATYPSGGRGISPPGTNAPGERFSYDVDYIFFNEYCSSTTPVAIIDNTSTTNSIQLSQKGEAYDIDVLVNISHPRTSELRLVLTSPLNKTVILSDYNGGDNDNYIGTIFDDEAMTSISDGNAPFTGHYKPTFPLSKFDNDPIAGNWNLRITENGFPNSGGILNGWCLHILYRDTTVIGVSETLVTNTLLYQNYPNPSNSTTTIGFKLLKNDNVSLRLFDSNGRLIRVLSEGYYTAGEHLIVASFSDLKPGTYHYTLINSKDTETRRLIIMK